MCVFLSPILTYTQYIKDNGAVMLHMSCFELSLKSDIYYANMVNNKGRGEVGGREGGGFGKLGLPK